MDTAGAGPRLVTRREAEPLLGYAPGSLKTVMQQQRGRWPDPVACRVHGRRALVWDLDALRDAVARGSEGHRGRRRPGADKDGLVPCLICGRRYRSLGPHLARIHQTSAAEYRAEYRLPASTALMADETRARLSETSAAAMARDPETIPRMRAAAPPLHDVARASASARAATDGLPAVRAARREGAKRTLPAAQQARRDAMESTAQSAGYPSMAAAIAATRSLSIHAAAARIGISRRTVSRWRQLSEGGES